MSFVAKNRGCYPRLISRNPPGWQKEKRDAHEFTRIFANQKFMSADSRNSRMISFPLRNPRARRETTSELGGRKKAGGKSAEGFRVAIMKRPVAFYFVAVWCSFWLIGHVSSLTRPIKAYQTAGEKVPLLLIYLVPIAFIFALWQIAGLSQLKREPV